MVPRTTEAPAAQVRLVHALADSLTTRGQPAQLIETHISWVIVAGDRAWKLKKAVAPGFLDFRSVERRRHFCTEELRLNRRLAPSLYLDVVPVTGSTDRPRLGGEGPVLDWAVAMRAFDPAGQWDRLAAAGGLGPAQIDALVDAVDRLHRDAPVASAAGPFGTASTVRRGMREVLDGLRDGVAGDARAVDAGIARGLDRLADWEGAAFGRLEPVFGRRLAEGRVRECHGDLHLGNVAEIDGRTVAFDGIEFEPALRWVDTASEIAFMAMDLQAHGLPALAHRFANGAFERSGDYDGLRTWRWYLAYRALVRARVAGLRGLRAERDRYVRSACHAAEPGRPALILTHGFSGSGKTTLAGEAVEALGAIRLRTDLERKRSAGIEALATSGSHADAGLYAPAAIRATYERLFALAQPVLEGGLPVVLDATFLDRGERDRARTLARHAGVPLVILDLPLPADRLRERVRRRAAAGGDASEADLAVLERQLARADALAADEAAEVWTCRDGRPEGGWPALASRIGA